MRFALNLLGFLLLAAVLWGAIIVTTSGLGQMGMPGDNSTTFEQLLNTR